MIRKKWLEKFIWLADRNKPARDFRTKLGIRFADIPKEIKKLGKYREELQDILDLEEIKIRLDTEVRIPFEQVEKELAPKAEPRKVSSEIFAALDKLPKPPEEDDDEWEFLLHDDEPIKDNEQED